MSQQPSGRWETTVGAIGPDARRLRDHDLARRWAWTTTDLVDGQPMTLLASGTLYPFDSDDGWYWNPVDRRAEVPTRSAATQTVLAASCAHRPGGWQLTTDVLGVQPLFYAVVDRSLWFSTSARSLIDTVREVVDRDLADDGPDPTGWQSIILLGFPVPGHSAYRSVRTMLPGQSVGIRSDGRLVSEVAVPRSAAANRSVDDLLAALRSSLPVLDTTPVDVPLSGGWDSRLLAALVAERDPRSITAWTTIVGDGIELDLDLAPAVARHLGIEHRTFIDESASWPDLAADVLHRTDYQSWMHAWIMPMADHLRRRGSGSVVDGFGGDFVLRKLFQTVERDESGRRSEAHREIWAEMGGSRAASELAWSDDARRWFASDASFDSFRQSVMHLDDHPNWQALTVVTTRAARCIGLAPFRLLEPELVVSTPFLAESVRDALYSESLYRARGPALYRDVIAALDPELAALPTTNDPDLPRVRSRARREVSTASLTAMAEQISVSDDALQLLAPRLRDAVRTTDLDTLSTLTRFVVPLRALQAAHALAVWQADHPTARAGIWEG